MKNKYRNLWFKSLNTPREEFYQNDAPEVLEYRGVKVYRRFNQSFDFVLSDCCIAQRAGITEARREIDLILDGQTPVCNEVCKHLTSNGFSPISYDQSHKLWLKSQAA